MKPSEMRLIAKSMNKIRQISGSFERNGSTGQAKFSRLFRDRNRAIFEFEEMKRVSGRANLRETKRADFGSKWSHWQGSNL